ncbi:MAG: S-methyl-5-thioribose kinase [Tissierellia bacterium]|nr:S-methyl-5-thioribose kinase [Tissierellia bacterium]
MAENKKRHYKLDLNTVIDYVIEKNLFDDRKNLESEEIGDGNINYIYRVKDRLTNKSVILKQADVLLRSSGRPLSIDRSRIEAEILKYYENTAGKFTPKIYDYDEIMCVIAMEDISEYKNMRKELMERKIFPKFAEDIVEFMVKTLLPTTDLIMDAELKKLEVKKYINPELCKISEDLVFTEPFIDYKGRNIITEGNLEFVEEYLYNDFLLHKEVALLKEEFMNNAQALIHGDLHTGSIFINEKGIKIIDPEFAFYGPIGYDSGNVIGNLFFDAAYNRFSEGFSEEFENWILDTAANILEKFGSELQKELVAENIVDPIRKNDLYLKEYIESILSYTMGASGLEILRRTVGDSKVIELHALKNGEARIAAERMLIKIGKEFIKNRSTIRTKADILKIYKNSIN